MPEMREKETSDGSRAKIIGLSSPSFLCTFSSSISPPPLPGRRAVTNPKTNVEKKSKEGTQLLRRKAKGWSRRMGISNFGHIFRVLPEDAI